MKLIKRLIKKPLTWILIVFICSISTVYASTDTYHQTLAWAENQKKIAQYHLKTNLYETVNNQIAKLTYNTEESLQLSEKQLEDFSKLESLGTSDSITNALKKHENELEQTAQSIVNNTSLDFDNIVSRVNHTGNEITNSVEYDYLDELSKLSSNQLPEHKIHSSQSNEQLDNEIQLTLATIHQLEMMLESESDPAIKEFILKKIDLLNQLIIILTDDDI
ncbi:hypothetical protein SM124_16565 [Bacillus sp. 31A1R]|uniref:Uncharacterized protein n=1 Tax=Robertmurraya mangrovi TaxID=3098077 RepID=A0ABU5J1R1_9BACI|nr:hypothetical protein [Bacillus sp. 31A1R]MDZ5473333.1 hypothetical protein [Bacillus sp. 31A1R]